MARQKSGNPARSGGRPPPPEPPSMGAPNPRGRRPSPAAIVKWTRGIGLAGLAIGIGSVVVTDWFWPGVGLCYFALAVLIADAWLEPELSSLWKWILTGILVLLGAGFSVSFVFSSAPLNVTALIADAPNQLGASVAGIDIKSDYTMVTLGITNDSDADYNSVDILIRPSSPIIKIAQLTSVPNCFLEPDNMIEMHQYYLDNIGKTKTENPLVLIATDAGYRFRCSKIPAGATVQIVFAVSEIRWNTPREQASWPMAEQIADPSYILKFKTDDFKSYWFGHENGDDFAKVGKPQWVLVNSKFYARLKPFANSERVPISGELSWPTP